MRIRYNLGSSPISMLPSSFSSLEEEGISSEEEEGMSSLSDEEEEEERVRIFLLGRNEENDDDIDNGNDDEYDNDEESKVFLRSGRNRSAVLILMVAMEVEKGAMNANANDGRNDNAMNGIIICRIFILAVDIVMLVLFIKGIKMDDEDWDNNGNPLLSFVIEVIIIVVVCIY